MIQHKKSEQIKADHFLHIHVIPKADKDLLEKTYRITDKCMKETWLSCLTDQSKYCIVDPQDLMQPIRNSYPELYLYLKKSTIISDFGALRHRRRAFRESSLLSDI